MKNRTTQERITQLQQNEVFVFGSNVQGQHIGGAARLAVEEFGAIMRQGQGPQGQCYAIPTMGKEIARAFNGERLEVSFGGTDYDNINREVQEFSFHASQNPNQIFLVTEIGCGIAGWVPEEIAPMFHSVISLPNVHLPKRFWEVLEKEARNA